MSPLFRFAFLIAFFGSLASFDANAQWLRHTIDDRGRGADGVRLLDINGDGREDVVTGWEESGHVCVYFQPPRAELKKHWPRVVVGNRPSVEDAVAVRINRQPIVISCHEGGERSVWVHRLTPESQDAAPSRWLDESAWTSVAVESCEKKTRWMFATAVHSRGTLTGIVIGSKHPNGQVSLLHPGTNVDAPIEVWELLHLQDAAWIMSLVPVDMDGDDDEDVVISERKGNRPGVYWLEQPNSPSATTGSDQWIRHDIVAGNREVMFIDAAPERILVSTRNGITLDVQRSEDGDWVEKTLPNPGGITSGKAVRWLGQSRRRFVFSSNTGVKKNDHGKPGVWIQSADSPAAAVQVSDERGVKFDRIEVRDLDGDGDPDILTCEERHGLGVFWYENPSR